MSRVSFRRDGGGEKYPLARPLAGAMQPFGCRRPRDPHAVSSDGYRLCRVMKRVTSGNPFAIAMRNPGLAVLVYSLQSLLATAITSL